MFPDFYYQFVDLNKRIFQNGCTGLLQYVLRLSLRCIEKFERKLKHMAYFKDYRIRKNCFVRNALKDIMTCYFYYISLKIMKNTFCQAHGDMLIFSNFNTKTKIRTFDRFLLFQNSRPLTRKSRCMPRFLIFFFFPLQIIGRKRAFPMPFQGMGRCIIIQTTKLR